jgi:serine/threonine protein kinase
MFPCVWCGASVQPGHMGCSSCQRSLLINGYHFDGFLGRGGIGSVYSATGPGGQKVAVKVVALSQGADWRTFDLFEKSSQMLQSLSHTGLPKTYGFAKSEEGKLFLFRERFDGGTLQERIQQGISLEPHNVRLLFDKLLQVLHYLHGRVPPMYHRDIKPSNIMFRSQMSWDPVFVDFDTVTFDAQRTGNTIIGTPGYTAPEQFAGMISPASDLYSLGATMLYVATHVEPDALPKQNGRFQVSHLLKNAEEGTQELIVQLLEPERQARPQSAQEALAILGSSPQKGSGLGFQVSFKGEPAIEKRQVGPHQLQGLSVAPQVSPLPIVRAPQAKTPVALWLLLGLLLVGGGMSFLWFGRASSSQITISSPASGVEHQIIHSLQEAPMPAPAEDPQEKLLATAPLKETNQDQLTPDEISTVMKAASAKFSKCVAIGEGEVSATFVILASGKVSSINTEAGTPLEICVARAIEKLQFPTFEGGSMSVTYPMIISKK